MLKPRNTVVVLDLIEQSEREQGGIVVPTNGELYAEAEVIAVGPGAGNVAGGNTETFDLKPGQRVFLQAKKRGRNEHGREVLEYAGIRYVVDDKVFFLYEQTSIFGIVAESGEWTRDAKPVAAVEQPTRKQQLMN